MLTYTQFLAEVLTTPLPFQWMTRTSEMWVAMFTTPSRQQYLVRFYHFPDDGVDKWHLVFIATDYELQRKGKQFDILGTGDAFAVFATVLTITKAFLQTARPLSVEFSAEEPSRIKLYDRFISFIRGRIPNYQGKITAQGEYLLIRQ